MHLAPEGVTHFLNSACRACERKSPSWVNVEIVSDMVVVLPVRLVCSRRVRPKKQHESLAKVPSTLRIPKRATRRAAVFSPGHIHERLERPVKKSSTLFRFYSVPSQTLLSLLFMRDSTQRAGFARDIYLSCRQTANGRVT